MDMEAQSRINHDYLSQLVSISQEQSEADLIPRLLRTLVAEQKNFINHPVIIPDTPEGRKAEQARVHKLKNVYLNLGCEHIGNILEEMYQALKEDRDVKERLDVLMEEFMAEAPVTLGMLQKELSTMTH